MWGLLTDSVNRALSPISRRQNRPNTRRRNVGVQPAAEQALSVRRAAFDIGRGLHIAALADRVFAIVDDVHHRAAAFAERGDDARHQAVAAAADAAGGAVDQEFACEDAVGVGAVLSRWTPPQPLP